jgi:hypothetical protein
VSAFDAKGQSQQPKAATRSTPTITATTQKQKKKKSSAAAISQMRCATQRYCLSSTEA